ncbi:MAG: hypothetical protein K2V38_05015 [Gemmataceae bacterium]|nr:hypothetical protein [Gemmataceae bacterium]
MSIPLRNGPTGLPAEFLIDATGRIVAGKYGKSAYDQWTVDELLDLAGKQRGSETRTGGRKDGGK